MGIAIIGTSIRGNLAALLLSKVHEVTVFEATDHPGGHANTVDVSVFGHQHQVNTVFMVFNCRTYPNFPPAAPASENPLLPQRKRARPSWHYPIPTDREHTASLTYDMGRLQRHHTQILILQTLNETASIDRFRTLRTFIYHQSAYSRKSIAVLHRFREINGPTRTHCCGAHWGYSFHEDGVQSALAVARHFGIELESCTAASTKARSLTTAASL